MHLPVCVYVTEAGPHFFFLSDPSLNVRSGKSHSSDKPKWENEFFK